jgi:hypothetical protein
VDGFDDLARVDALEIDRGHAEIAVAELALDDAERDAFAGEFDGAILSDPDGSSMTPRTC